MNKNVIKAFCLLVVVGTFIFFIQGKKNKIKKNLGITTSVVTKVDYFDRYNHHRIDYCYKVKGINLYAYIFADEIDINKLIKLKGKSFLVAFDTLNPQNSCILFRSQDYADYDLTYPDSLAWIGR